MRQRILGSHTPPCHRRMVITTQFSVVQSRSLGGGTPFVVLLRVVVGAYGGLCVPGAPGPCSGAWVPHHEAAEGVCGSGDLQLPPAHD